MTYRFGGGLFKMVANSEAPSDDGEFDNELAEAALADSLNRLGICKIPPRDSGIYFRCSSSTPETRNGVQFNTIANYEALKLNPFIELN